MIDVAKLVAELSPEKRALLARHLQARRGGEAPQPTPPTPPAAEEREHYPLSSGQQRLWFLQQLEPQSAAYNYPVGVRARGRLNVAALERSIGEIVRRHEILRANFVKIEGRPAQRIRPHEPFTLKLVDLTRHAPAEREARAISLATDEAHLPFDLTSELLFRAVLLRLEEEHHLLLLSAHHIVFDGWSLGIFLRELGLIYGAFDGGKPSPLPEPTFRYVEYAQRQQHWFDGERYEELLDYWKRRLRGAPPQLQLPADRPRPEAQTFRGAQQTLTLPAGLCEGLKALGRRHGATLFMTLLAAFKALLHRYSGQTDIVVGTDTANRGLVETEDLIGFFVNILVLRTDLGGDPNFLELLGRVREVALQAYAHEELPFEKLVEALRPGRPLGYTPLVQTLFLVQNAPLSLASVPGLALSLQEFGKGTSKFDLVVSVAEGREGLGCAINYSTDIFEDETIRRMLSHFANLLAAVVARPEARLKELTIFTAEELREKNMELARQQESKLQKLRNAKRKPLDLSQASLVGTSFLAPGATLPLVLQPNNADVDVVGWAADNRALIEEQLQRHGAILFRGFGVRTVPEFERLAALVCRGLFGEYGDLPREAKGEKIYESTPYPADQAILFHNESSHMHSWPMKQWFYCVKAAQDGGETPIVDCREIYRRLDPELVAEFSRKKLMYVRNFIAGLDVSWQDFFKTSERAAVEDYCRGAGMSYEWRGENDLKVSHVCQAVARHPKTGEMVFFNQIQLHHVSMLAPEVRRSMLSVFDEEHLPRNVYFGDGSRIEDEVVKDITELYREAAASFPWQEGDVLFLDNMLVAHARNPFVGPRKIVVAMGEMINNREVEAQGE